LVNSGRELVVKVDADSSAFQTLSVYTRAQIGMLPPLFGPPYVFNLRISPDASSGPYTLTAVGALTSGGDPVGSEITIDVERADNPRQLVPELSTIYFSYVGDHAPTLVTGVFADGTRVMLTHSTYTAYSSDTPSVAKVDEQGTVTAVSPGKAKIRITYRDAFIEVPAYVPVPITVHPSTTSLYASQTEKFAATLFMDPNLDQSVIWSISPSIGSIDQTGFYTAPSSASARQRINVTVTSVANPAERASAQVWIRPRPRK
jgi:hypothetical protein